MSKFENRKLTIVVTKGEEFYVETIKEIPAVISQDSTVDEAREMVLDTLKYLEDRQQERVFGNTVLEEDLLIA